jgi:hemoglobin
VEARGHPRLRRRHVSFATDQRARDRWIALMLGVLLEAGPSEAYAMLRPFFEATATFMINRPLARTASCIFGRRIQEERTPCTGLLVSR